MANIRLIPSSYSTDHSSYATVYSGATNMYNNTDHTANYASLRGRNNSTTTAYHIFIKGFNFNDVPSGAIVTNFEIKIRCYRNSYQRTGENYRLRLSASDSMDDVIDGSIIDTDIGTTSGGTVYTIPHGSMTWSELKNYGSDFSVVVPLSSTASNRPYVYVYGVEINVTYTLGSPRTITSTLTGSGTINPSGATTYYDGTDYTITINPTNKTDTVTVTNNNTDVTNDLVTHYQTGPTTSDNRVLGTYALVSGSFNGSGASYFQGIVGKGYNGSTTTSNYYSGGSSTIAVFTYDMSFTLPAGSVVTSLSVQVNGHAESTSQSNEYMCARLISGSTELSPELNFKSVGTSNSTQTITATVMPTVEQVANMKLQCRLGYYGGAINGATCYIEYAVPTSDIDYYTYTYTVSGDATIAVVIGSGGS